MHIRIICAGNLSDCTGKFSDIIEVGGEESMTLDVVVLQLPPSLARRANAQECWEL